MSTKIKHVKYVKNLKVIVFLLQLFNNVSSEPSVTPVQNGGVSSFQVNEVENVYNNKSTTAEESKSSSEPSKSVLSTRNIDLSNTQKDYPNASVQEATRGTKDGGVQNATKSLQLDSNKEKETAHIHVFTGL